MRDEQHHMPYRVAIVTLDAHAAGPALRIGPKLSGDFPGLTVNVHAAAEWSESPDALDRAKEAVGNADLVIVNLLFLEEHVRAILPVLKAQRDRCDAMIGMVADGAVVQLTRMGALDMSKPASGAMKLLKRLRGSNKPSAASGAKQMKMLRRLPKLLRLIPGKSQDLRAWFLTMQYWLGGSDDNLEQMVRFLLSRYASRPDWHGADSELPVTYPDLGLYHPDLSERITTDPAALPSPDAPVATVGLLMMRSYILSRDTAHYDAVIRALEARNIRVLPAFSGGLDGRPAIEAYHSGVDTLVSLTGFSLVGGPAYNDSSAAVDVLKALDVPYLSAQPLEFQTIQQWDANAQGLGPVEATMLVALPEIDGAIVPTVFAGREGSDKVNAMAPVGERVEMLAARAAKLAILHRKANAGKRVAIVLYGFPPNSGAAGTAAYLSVFESLWHTLTRLKAEGYQVEVPQTVDALRTAVLQGNAAQFGQEANVAARVSASDIVRSFPWLDDVEAAWGPAPGTVQTDGRDVYVLGRDFGHVFVGVQPAFGYEGDPMRLLFEHGFAPTHAFCTFYQWLKADYCADVVLHFGMHGALEFMPGKQTGLSGACWPDRLIGDLPNVYLYAANNPSEASLAKRRSGAVTVSHLTPTLRQAGLYKGLAELKDSVRRWREMNAEEDRSDLESLIHDQAHAVDLNSRDISRLWQVLLETEAELITNGLHVMGRPLSEAAQYDLMALMPDHPEAAEHLKSDAEMTGLMQALSARYIPPVPGGDIIRNPGILPTGRNIHAFDPFRMPTSFAMSEGAKQAGLLLRTHDRLPRMIALVLWGSDTIKTDGGPIGQAMALMGTKPRFDSYGRLSGADLIPLEKLGRPRVDVVMTLSGIFRDLLPLQTRMLAEAALTCAKADEPANMNPIRGHTLALMDATGCDLETAALRVFSNAEGAYGSNVNTLVGSAGFGDEDELAEAYEARKSFAYGVGGKPAQQSQLLQSMLGRVDLAYQNLESVELGVTTVDHYFDTLGGIARAVRRAKGGEATPVYIGDQTKGEAKVRTLSDQIALETRARSLNPRFYEPLLDHGHEGVRQIEAHVTNTLGWSATTGKVEPWVYQRLSETFVLDEEMRRRLADKNPVASAKMAERLLEASDREYWRPDAETLAALQEAADELEDRMEGIG